MTKLKKFIPITKIDVEQRLVYGTATAEEPDMSNEICDYATTKPYYEKWSGNIAKATDGKSVGNLRSMHSHIAAGKLTTLTCDDATKRIEICGKVVDDGEWNKVLEGVYTGFSQGGRYVKRWKDPTNPELTRYTSEPIEVSLVDVPCLPSATFEAIKGAGIVEMRKFASVIAEPTASEIAAKAAELCGDKPWSEYIDAARDAIMKAAAAKAVDEMPDADADEPKADTKPDAAKAAGDGEWSQVWVHPRLPGKTFGKKAELQQALVDLDATEAAKVAAGGVTDKIDAIGKELDKREGKQPDAPPATAAKAADAPAGDTAATKPLKMAIKIARAVAADVAKARKPEDAALLVSKGLYDVGRLASLISELAWLQDSLNYEALIEADGSLVPEQLQASIASLCAVLRRLVEEETAELVGDGAAIEVFEMAAGMVPHGHIDALVKFAAGTPTLAKCNDAIQKVGARHSKADVARINTMHELAVELGADCGGDADKHQPGGDLVKMKAERDAFENVLKAIAPKLDETLERVKKIEAQPLPGGPARTNVISKERDGLGGGAGGNAGGDLDKMLANLSDDERVNLAFKLAQQNGRPLQIGGPSAS